MLKKYFLPLITIIILFTNSVTAQTVTVYLTYTGGSYPGDKWANITTGINGGGTQVWGQGNGTLGNGAGLLTDEAITLNCATTYYFNVYDKWGDAWDGTTYELRDASGGGGTLIINNGGSVPDGYGGFNSSTWIAGVDLETSESFNLACPCSPDIGIASSIVTNCFSGTFDISLMITDPTSGGSVTVSDGGTNPNQVVTVFPTTVIFTGYTSGSTITLNADNGTCNINANAITENCDIGYSCALAQPIANGYTQANITSAGSGGIEDWVTTADASCGGASDGGFENGDVHLFSYTTGASVGESFYFTIDHDYSADGEHSIGVWTGCTGGTLSGCEQSTFEYDNVVGVCAQNLAANTTYYIGVGKEYDSGALNFDIIDFSVETTGTTPDDECATSPIISLTDTFSGSTRCSYTASAGSPSGCGSIENDSWIAFVADSVTALVDYNVSDCSNGNGVQLSAWSGSCGSLSMIAGSCLNYAANNSSGTWTFSGLTVGNTYYIRADGYAGDLCSYTYDPIAGVLPIKLTNFSGTPLKNGYNRLNWTTETEINNDYFVLEKSEDAHNFKTVNTQNGAGNSNKALNYFDYDTPTSETTYYRLKQVDFNGNFTYSEIIAISNSNNSFKIYPNPSSDGFINIDKLNGYEHINLTDAQGKIVGRFKALDNSSLQINLSDYKKGLYYLVITTNQNVITEKIIIQ